jgi:L-iditol 2-dehydrogenase
MRVAAITGPRQVELQERPDPKAAGSTVTVAVEIAPLCTEFKGWVAGQRSDRLGHEAVGRVIDACQSEIVRSGDRVVVMPQYGCGICEYCVSGEHIYCRHQRDVLEETGSVAGTATLAEVVLKPDWLLVPIPDDMSSRHAAMACCGFGPGFSAVKRMGIAGPEVVLVSGCGPVGLGALICAQALGATVIGLELQPYRQDLAWRLGAALVVDPREKAAADAILSATRGRGVDAAVETTNAEAAQRVVLQALRPLGRLTYVGWGAVAQVPDIVPQGLQVNGCWHWNHKAHAPEMLSVIRASAGQIDTFVTHTFPFEELGEAFELQRTGRCGKVLISVGREE